MDVKNTAILTARKTNYINPNYTYLKNVTIVEWDIKSAGLSVLKYKKALPAEYLQKLESMPKEERTIKEGLLQKKYPKLASLIVDTLSEAREWFVNSNDILDSEILSIKKDAIFLINHQPLYNTFETFTFRKKGTYTSYLRIDKKEFLYSSFDNTLTVKGIPSIGLEKQQKYIIEDIKKFLKISEYSAPNDIYELLKNYRSKYLNRELPIEYYRELDTGMFRSGKYMIEHAGEDMKNEIDISQNYIKYLAPIFSALI